MSNYDRVSIVFGALATNTSVEALTLIKVRNQSSVSCYQLGELFARVLQQNKTLRRIFMYDCNATDGFIRLMAIGLRDVTCLQYLSLHKGFIGNDGAIALANIIENNRTLIEVSLSMNYIGNTGAIALANAVKNRTNNVELFTLELSSNCIGEMGLQALIQMWIVYTPLKLLTIDYSTLIESSDIFPTTEEAVFLRQKCDDERWVTYCDGARKIWSLKTKSGWNRMNIYDWLTSNLGGIP
jgi:hypothetical protein